MRNHAAGGTRPATFGRSKATNDMFCIAKRVDEVILHLLGSLDAYIDKKQYIR